MAKDATPTDIATLKSQIDLLTKQLDFHKEFSALREQVNLQLSYYKWIGAIFAVAATILGFFGIKGWSDLRDTTQKTMQGQIANMSSQASDLSRGFILVDTQRYSDAIPYLRRSYERDHYDEPVDNALLDALSSNSDFDAAFSVIEELKKDSRRFYDLKNPYLLNNIGRVLLYEAIDNPALLDQAHEMLDKSLRTFPPDDRGRRYPLYSFFRFYVVKGDLEQAEQYLLRAYNLDSTYGSESHVNDAWVVKLQSKRPTATKEILQLLSEVRKTKN